MEHPSLESAVKTEGDSDHRYDLIQVNQLEHLAPVVGQVKLIPLATNTSSPTPVHEMRNTRQGAPVPDGEEVLMLQQIMEMMRVLQQANEDHHREQDHLREEAQIEQERLREEARVKRDQLREEARAEQAKLRDEARAEQEQQREARAYQDPFLREVEASHKMMEETTWVKEELQKANEKLHRTMLKHQQHQRQTVRVHSSDPSSRDDSQPFSRQIMDEPIPSHFLTMKMTPFSAVEDPENHLKAFKAQMIISSGSDAVRCKMLMGTFTGTTLH